MRVSKRLPVGLAVLALLAVPVAAVAAPAAVPAPAAVSGSPADEGHGCGWGGWFAALVHQQPCHRHG